MVRALALRESSDEGLIQPPSKRRKSLNDSVISAESLPEPRSSQCKSNDLKCPTIQSASSQTSGKMFGNCYLMNY